MLEANNPISHLPFSSRAMRKQKVAMLSIYSNSFLVVLKLAAGLLMMSVSVISEAIHSMIDLVAAAIANYSVRQSGKPADEDHQYGHGKYENYAGVIEAILIFFAALIIIYESILKFFSHGPVEFLWAGIIIMGISVVVNTYVSRRLYQVGIEEDSIALQADGLHLRTDVYTSLGVFLGLILINLTGWTFLDPMVAIFVALMIFKAAFDLTKEAQKGLVDEKLPDDEVEKVKKVLEEHRNLYVGFHELRTRKSGSDRFIDVHLVVRYNITMSEASKVSEHMAADIERCLPNCHVTVKLEPCESEKCEIANKKGFIRIGE
jgi:cation diffusion facilitator family transporter